ncbi:MAG: hydroxymethylglutaryl-CoA lyase [Candidatus Neomarinimicrobiota bacterium]
MLNPSEITIMETGLRDGIQVVERYVPIKDRVIIVNGLIDAGIKNIQIVSFVNPRKVPQMSEAEDLISRLSSNNNIEYSALVFNRKGVERAINSGINKIETSISLSESYNQKNLGLNNLEAIERLENVIRLGLENKLNIRAGLQCVWGTQDNREIDLDNITSNISLILNLGVDKISLCDTSGMATPDTISRLLEFIYNDFPKVNICLHLHNTYGYGLKNLCCALQFGIKEIDTSLGGIGGTPYLKNSKGNIATEDTVSMLEKMGYHTGIDYKKVAAQSRFLKKIIGGKYFSGEMYKKFKSY